MCACLAVLVLCLPLATAHAVVSERARAAMSERVAPVGEACIQGTACAKTAVVSSVRDTGAGARSPEQIYQSVCSVCHDTGAGGAAKLTEKEKWVAKRVARTVEEIYRSAIDGRNAMPPRGNCLDCSDEDIKRTVDYMLERVR